MITFLVVGRNDGYGINLHKRTALSLNFMASLCEDPDDEIIYVDCNTLAEEVTLTEAIADTLTPQARQRIKTYRISGEQMRGAIGDTPLPFSDELSRNVGIRRSNPRNPWLLSTNCDILIQPLGRQPLSQFFSTLPPRFFLCPRVPVMIPQWQCLNRADVGQIGEFCDAVIGQGFRFPPEKEQTWLRFASVGDFQLAPRKQWFEIGGCEEGMKYWGHSDANNARRLNLLNGGGKTPDLSSQLAVFHLNHNPSVKVAHEVVMIHNDWKVWVDDVTSPQSRNPSNWGLADMDLPLIRIDQNLSAKDILKTHRRPRTVLSSLKTKVQMILWNLVSRGAHRLEQGK
jgi:hypothetical protein